MQKKKKRKRKSKESCKSMKKTEGKESYKMHWASRMKSLSMMRLTIVLSTSAQIVAAQVAAA